MSGPGWLAAGLVLGLLAVRSLLLVCLLMILVDRKIHGQRRGMQHGLRGGGA